jgi:DNA invertase Pin-like site-specific DNA recombinase
VTRIEKVSGVAARRPELERTLDELEAGDVLVVTKLDRLGRSTLNLLRIIDQIGREGAGLKSLGEPWADTTTSAGRLMLTVLSGIAEFERDLILQRTNEGRARAMAEGKRFGRKPKLTKHQAREALKRCRRDAARDRALLQRRSRRSRGSRRGTPRRRADRAGDPGGSRRRREAHCEVPRHRR